MLKNITAWIITLTLILCSGFSAVFADGTESSEKFVLYDDWINWNNNTTFFFDFEAGGAAKEDSADIKFEGDKAKHIVFTKGEWSGYCIKDETNAHNFSDYVDGGYLSFYIYAEENADDYWHNRNHNIAMMGSDGSYTSISLGGYISPKAEWQHILIPLSEFSGVNFEQFNYIEYTNGNNSGDFYLDKISFIQVNKPTGLEKTDTGIKWNASTTTTDSNDVTGGVTKYQVYRDNVMLEEVAASGLSTYTFDDEYTSLGEYIYDVVAVTACGAKSGKATINVLIDNIEYSEGTKTSMHTVMFDDTFESGFGASPMDNISFVNDPVASGTASMRISNVNGGYFSCYINNNSGLNISSLTEDGYLAFSIYAGSFGEWGNKDMIIWLEGGNGWIADSLQMNDYITIGDNWNNVLIPMKTIMRDENTVLDWSNFKTFNIVGHNPLDFFLDRVGFVSVAAPSDILQTDTGISWRASATTTSSSDITGGVTGYDVYRDNEFVGNVPVNGTGYYTFDDAALEPGEYTYGLVTKTAGGAVSAKALKTVYVPEKQIEINNLHIYSGETGTDELDTLVPGQKIRVVSEMNNIGNEVREAVLVLAVYINDGNEIEYVDVKNLVVEAGTSEFGLGEGQYITYTLPNDVSGYKVKAFLWNGLSDITPLCTSVLK